MPFTVSGTLFALLPVALATLFGYFAPRHPGLWRTLPRERNFGIALGAACLVWSAFYAVPMLEGGLAKFQPIVKLLVPAVTILSYFYLNYIFTRALGGLMMLAATFMLHEAFAAHVPMRFLFSTCCYAIAVAGMVALATPWRFRDLLKKCTENPSWRKALAISNGILAVIIAVFTALGR